ncbi:MAG: Asp-tRNA(Asn)/Glu-tRNA(Gln) amidotransferase subunit GatB [Planctomycetes bacterium]|nr:Asp-tRNA(Asn)/Glu-tRNA(Gln) amidotransferase subunit GatB [Planctomycetota bacterium]
MAVIGLECHVQLATRTKLFCGCEYRFGAPANSITCPVCTAQPGVLPVLNREALALAVRVALAIGATVPERSKFDRKHYFYCDLPKGYQISQYDQPFCHGGGLTLASGQRIRLARIHLEEDAGKAIHDRGDMTLVDLNRAGVPLVEAVSEADIETAAEAVEYLGALKEILQYTGASDCDMEKGELRCDVNISVRQPAEPWRTKVEVKNLNSFRHVAAAIEHELARQVEVYETGGSIRQETRLFDPERGVTRAMRSKESAHDYRYFAEPDLPAFRVDAAFRERARGAIPELPASRRARYAAEYGLSDKDCAALTAERVVADFFEAAARLSERPRECANWIQNELFRMVGEAESGYAHFGEIPLKPHDLAEVVRLVGAGTIQNAAGRTLLGAMARTGRSARILVQELGLEQVSDASQIEAWCRAVLAEKPQIVADVRAGKPNALNALLGPVMKASGGKANAALVRATLERLVRETA